jgi:hypothetical protein
MNAEHKHMMNTNPEYARKVIEQKERDEEFDTQWRKEGLESNSHTVYGGYIKTKRRKTKRNKKSKRRTFRK